MTAENDTGSKTDGAAQPSTTVVTADGDAGNKENKMQALLSRLSQMGVAAKPAAPPLERFKFWNTQPVPRIGAHKCISL